MAKIGENIEIASDYLRSGSLIGMPTETVYGLAGNAFNEDALLKIFKVKNRPKFDPLIAHTNSLEKVESLAISIPQAAYDLGHNLWPGPLTLLLEKKEYVSDLLTSGLPRVAVRIPNHPLALQLLNALDFPLAAPSANPFGYVSPTSAAHVDDQLGQKIPYILDGGNCKIGMESTIVGFENEMPIIYRLGGATIESIEKIAGKTNLHLNQSSDPSAPGMLKSHYAPTIQVIIGHIETLIEKYHNHKIGIITFNKKLDNFAIQKQITLSPKGDIDEAASRLFQALRAMDQSDVDIILTEKFPEIGLGRAINDRLNRAAAR